MLRTSLTLPDLPNLTKTPLGAFSCFHAMTNPEIDTSAYVVPKPNTWRRNQSKDGRCFVLTTLAKRHAGMLGCRFDADSCHISDDDLIEEVRMDRTDKEECRV